MSELDDSGKVAVSSASCAAPPIDPYDNTRGNRNNYLFLAIKEAAADCQPLTVGFLASFTGSDISPAAA